MSIWMLFFSSIFKLRQCWDLVKFITMGSCCSGCQQNHVVPAPEDKKRKKATEVKINEPVKDISKLQIPTFRESKDLTNVRKRSTMKGKRTETIVVEFSQGNEDDCPTFVIRKRTKREHKGRFCTFSSSISYTTYHDRSTCQIAKSGASFLIHNCA